MILILAIVLAYLSGSIPAGVWIARLVRGIDIRDHGSGNTGAANVARVVGVPWGILVGVIDVAKGFAPVFWLGPLAAPGAHLAIPDARLILGAAAIVGHLYPVFAGFKGGKGVLTAAGGLIVLLPNELAIAVVVWGIVFGMTRIVSAASLLAALTLLVAVLIRRFVMDAPITTPLVLATSAMTVLVFATHRSNIRRILKGQEARFGKHANGRRP